MKLTTLLTALALAMGLAQAAHAQPPGYPPSPRWEHPRDWDDDWARRARWRCNQSWDWWCSRHCWRNERGYLECRPDQDDRDRDEYRNRNWRRWP